MWVAGGLYLFFDDHSTSESAMTCVRCIMGRLWICHNTPQRQQVTRDERGTNTGHKHRQRDIDKRRRKQREILTFPPFRVHRSRTKFFWSVYLHRIERTRRGTRRHMFLPQFHHHHTSSASTSGFEKSRIIFRFQCVIRMPRQFVSDENGKGKTKFRRQEAMCELVLETTRGGFLGGGSVRCF